MGNVPRGVWLDPRLPYKDTSPRLSGELPEDTITAYTQEFTEPELKKLMEFYKTPVGKKASEKMPQLAFISGQIGLKKAQANQAELRQMIEEQKGKQGGGG